ncbi:MAG: hypothetical protein ACREQ5_06385 [Candidatus Dormibacteria bacterium]
MSFLNTLKADTIGVAYRAFTGNVDPYTLANIQENTNAGIAKAGTGQDPSVIAAQQAAAARDITSVLNANDANPLNPDGSLKVGLRVPGLGVVGTAPFLKNVETLVYSALGLVVIGGVAYLAVKLHVFKGRATR